MYLNVIVVTTNEGNYLIPKHLSYPIAKILTWYVQ